MTSEVSARRSLDGAGTPLLFWCEGVPSSPPRGGHPLYGFVMIMVVAQHTDPLCRKPFASAVAVSTITGRAAAPLSGAQGSEMDTPIGVTAAGAGALLSRPTAPWVTVRPDLAHADHRGRRCPPTGGVRDGGSRIPRCSHKTLVTGWTGGRGDGADIAFAARLPVLSAAAEVLPA